jgi:uncharacterized protein YecT (DUF1311 family)
MKACLSVLAASVLSVVLGASNLKAQTAYRHPCADHSQTALNECAWEKFRAADAAMTKVFTATRSTDSTRAVLQTKAQSAWVVFRDAQCAVVARAYEGGSMQLLQQGSCLEALTRARRRQLVEIAKW